MPTNVMNVLSELCSLASLMGVLKWAVGGVFYAGAIARLAFTESGRPKLRLDSLAYDKGNEMLRLPVWNRGPIVVDRLQM